MNHIENETFPHKSRSMGFVVPAQTIHPWSLHSPSSSDQYLILQQKDKKIKMLKML